MDRFHNFRIGDQVVERNSTLVDLQPVDHGKSTVVTDNHDHLVTRQNRAVEIRIQHHRRSVTDKHDHFAVGPGHLGAPTAADLISHARESVLAVEVVDFTGAPSVVHLARKAAGSSDDVITGSLIPIHYTDNLSVGGSVTTIGRCGDLVDVGVVSGHFVSSAGSPGFGSCPFTEYRGEAT